MSERRDSRYRIFIERLKIGIILVALIFLYLSSLGYFGMILIGMIVLIIPLGVMFYIGGLEWLIALYLLFLSFVIFQLFP